MKHAKKFLAIALSFAPFSALAASACNGSGLCNPLGYNSLDEFLERLLQVVAQIGFPVVVLFIVYVGFLYVSAGGNPKKLSKAHSYFFWAVVGSLVVLGAEALSLAIKATVHDLSQGL